MSVAAVHAADGPVKIGFVNTFSGPNAALGNDERDGFELALDHLGRKMGGLPVDVAYEDDQMKPDIGKQVTEKLILARKVDFITGFNWSNVLLASLKPAVDNKTFLIGGGPVAELVGIEGGVVSGVINLESSGVEASDWRPRHDEQYYEA
jgi:branched-chain amino acid transport system substrate-binding protein